MRTYINFTKVHPDAGYPQKATAKSSGYDLYSVEDVSLVPGQIVKVKTGITLQLPEGIEAQVRSRSGLASQGVFVLNGIGTIDNDYEGEILVLLHSVADTVKFLPKGSRVAQLVFSRVLDDVLIEKASDYTYNNTGKLCVVPRGTGGFGSSGI